MGKKIGLYGGTFDPIHLGHLNAAVNLLEACALDEVWFCPAAVSPHKLDGSPVDAYHRLEMVARAIQAEPRFKILDTEIARKTPSYTIDTLQELLATQTGKENPRRFYLLLGEDALPDFPRWKQPEEIVKLVPLRIASRTCKPFALDAIESMEIREAIRQGLVPTPVFDISATGVRERLKKRLYCEHLVPGKVLDYIFKHGLYC